MNCKSINKELQLINVLLTNIIQPQCLLVIGPHGSGKTCLIKHLSGKMLDYSEISESFQMVVPDHGNSFEDKMSLNFAWHTVSENNLLIVEIPNIFVDSDHEQIKNEPEKYLLSLFLWRCITELSIQISVCMVFPFECCVNTYPMMKFLRNWELLLSECSEQDEKFNQFKQSICMVYTKLQSHEDIQQFDEIFKGLSYGQQQGIPKDSSFFKGSLYPFIFLNQEKKVKQGSELLKQILNKTSFVPSQDIFAHKSTHKLLLSSTSNLQNHIMKESQYQQLKNNCRTRIQLIGMHLWSIYSTKNQKLALALEIKQLDQRKSKYNANQDYREQVINWKQLLSEHQYTQIITLLLKFYKYIHHQFLNSDLKSATNIQLIKTLTKRSELTQTQQKSNDHRNLDHHTNKLKEIYQMIFQSQIWKKLATKSKLLRQIAISIHITIKQIQLLSQIYVETKSKFIDELLNDVRANIKYYVTSKKLVRILQENDTNFSGYAQYQQIKDLFHDEKRLTGVQLEQSEEQICQQIERIKRCYLNNDRIKQKLSEFINIPIVDETPKQKNQISKLINKIQQQKSNNQNFVELLLKKLLQYRQYECYIQLKVQAFGELPGELVFRTYLNQIKKSNKNDKFDFLVDKFLPLTQSITIQNQNYQIALQAQNYTQKCCDFISAENDLTEKDYLQSEGMIREQPHATQFQYDSDDKPPEKPQKYQMNKQQKIKIKKNTEQKRKSMISHQDKILQIIKQLMI